MPEILEGEEEYEVERILDKAKKRGVWKWLVKWKGYPTEEATWEPKSSLKNAQKALKDFEKLRTIFSLVFSL